MSIVDELKVVPTGDEDDEFWDAVYENTGAAESAMTVFVKVALRFKDFSRRKTWFINFVNENLASADMVGSQQQIAERWGRAPTFRQSAADFQPYQPRLNSHSQS